MREKVLDIGLGNDFLDLTQKAKAAKANKWNCIKQKKPHGTGQHQLNGKAAYEWENIF